MTDPGSENRVKKKGALRPLSPDVVDHRCAQTSFVDHQSGPDEPQDRRRPSSACAAGSFAWFGHGTHHDLRVHDERHHLEGRHRPSGERAPADDRDQQSREAGCCWRNRGPGMPPARSGAVLGRPASRNISGRCWSRSCARSSLFRSQAMGQFKRGAVGVGCPRRRSPCRVWCPSPPSWRWS